MLRAAPKPTAPAEQLNDPTVASILRIDERKVLTSLKTLLELYRYSVITADNRVAGLALRRNYWVNAVRPDYNMRNINGEEMARRWIGCGYRTTNAVT